jgi:hypothetical protein
MVIYALSWPYKTLGRPGGITFSRGRALSISFKGAWSKLDHPYVHIFGARKCLT